MKREKLHIIIPVKISDWSRDKKEQFTIKNDQFLIFFGLALPPILFFRLDFSAAIKINMGEAPVKTAMKTVIIKTYRRKTTISPKKVYFFAHIFFLNCAHLKQSLVYLAKVLI